MNIVSKAMDYFGLTPLHDVDLPDEPSARSEPLPVDRVGDLAYLRSVLLDALCWIDEIDPTPGELAQTVDISDLDAKRKGRQSRT